MFMKSHLIISPS